MTAAHVAQINIGTMVAPTDDPAVAEFMDNLDRINAIAEDAPGFVWRLQTDESNATDIHVFPKSARTGEHERLADGRRDLRKRRLRRRSL